MDDKFRSRKFLLACFFAVVGTIGLFTDKIGAGEYIALTTSVLGLYSFANATIRKSELSQD